MSITRRQFLRVGGASLILGVIPLPVKLLGATAKDTRRGNGVWIRHLKYAPHQSAEEHQRIEISTEGHLVFVAFERVPGGITEEQLRHRYIEPSLLALWNALKANFGATKRDKFFKIGGAVVRNGPGSWVEDFTL